MTDWLVVMSADNWEICASERLLGLGRDAERRLNRMIGDDRVWIYVNRLYVDRALPVVGEIRGVARVAGSVRHLDKIPWKPRGSQRFEYARAIEVERRYAFPARHLLRTMSFAGRPPYWAASLLNAPVRLAEKDVHTLETAASAVGPPAQG